MGEGGDHRPGDAHIVPQHPPRAHQDAGDVALLDEDLVDVSDLFAIGAEHLGLFADQDQIAAKIGDVLGGCIADGSL